MQEIQDTYEIPSFKVDAKHDQIYFISNKSKFEERQLYRLSMKSGAMETSSKPSASGKLEGKPRKSGPQNFSAAPPKPAEDSNPFAALKNLKLK